MQDQWLQRMIALRDEAWGDVQTSKSYKAFKEFDDVVAKLGGKRLIAEGVTERVVFGDVVHAEIRPASVRRLSERVTHADAAISVLQRHGKPMPIHDILAEAGKLGARIGGTNPLANFRSTLSKDERFYAFTKDSTFYWWLDGKALPENWNEAPDLPYQEGSGASSVHSNQEGGEANATAT